MTARSEILQAARDLTGRGITPFTVQDVIDELRRHGSRYADSTIRTHVTSRMCADAPCGSPDGFSPWAPRCCSAQQSPLA